MGRVGFGAGETGERERNGRSEAMGEELGSWREGEERNERWFKDSEALV